MPTHELDVLTPVDPALSNTDDYPIYPLGDATVYYAARGAKGNAKGHGNANGNGGIANLLEAGADRMLRIEGRLEVPEREWRGNLLKKSFKPTDVCVTDVQRFAYGVVDSGEVVIWGLGQAGWFEIRPSREYEGIYKDMVEAVGMLFFMADVYNEQPRKKGGGPRAELVFQEYAEDERFECEDAVDAAEIFRKHRAFLIASFLTRAEGVAWSNTPMIRFVKKEYPDDLAHARARIEGTLGAKTATAAKPLNAEPAQRSTRSISTTARRKPEAADTPNPLRKDDNWWEAAVIFEFMQKAVNHRAMHKGRITVSKVARLITKRYEVEDDEMATNIIMVHATNLHYMMQNPRRKNIAYFASEPIFQELAAGHSLPAAEVRRAEAIELRPRKDRRSLKDEATSDFDSSSSAATPKRPQRASKKGHLSVLRPKSGKYSGKSGKGKGVKRGKGKQPHFDMDSDAETGEEEAEESSNDGIDTPTQAFSPGKRKLLHHHDEDKGPRKRTASASIEPASPPASSSEDEEEPGTNTESLPLRWRSGNTSKPKTAASASLVPSIISTPLPTYTANGPGDSWICSFDGCKRKIYGASSETGRELITEHLGDHERGREKVVGIVLGEEQRLRLPVNNLIKRIREMTEAQTPLFPAMGAGTSIGVGLSPIRRHA
ncbi:hypothetical protein P154DRAFT_579572 [Amniculicola lignicola CBS 123094]|uniref:Uncharacterized protein n=1 Tax=Amniculicola lignicola CBS 123094 TaxID=1392246 RepID=A0A6A5W4J9_9PLEO|nr:hypothetical protein P154DRAFT_579572 [Amniculicola lignicola CBS 123094]